MESAGWLVLAARWSLWVLGTFVCAAGLAPGGLSAAVGLDSEETKDASASGDDADDGEGDGDCDPDLELSWPGHRHTLLLFAFDYAAAAIAPGPVDEGRTCHVAARLCLAGVFAVGLCTSRRQHGLFWRCDVWLLRAALVFRREIPWSFLQGSRPFWSLQSCQPLHLAPPVAFPAFAHNLAHPCVCTVPSSTPKNPLLLHAHCYHTFLSPKRGKPWT